MVPVIPLLLINVDKLGVPGQRHGDGAPTLQGFVESRTEPTAQVYTDEAAAYRGLNRSHETVKHSAREYVHGMAHTNGIEMSRGLEIRPRLKFTIIPILIRDGLRFFTAPNTINPGVNLAGRR